VAALLGNPIPNIQIDEENINDFKAGGVVDG
jgi:hypothetical protein